jgi:uncharacterized protein (TIGR04255 family)
MPSDVFKIDLNESFPRLARAPIVEAVIHWQARAQNSLEREALLDRLAARLPHYTSREPLQQFELMAMVTDKEDEPVVQHTRGWQGFRLKSDDGTHVVVFKADGLVFSRTQGYDHWEPFVKSAKDAWRAFVEIAAPVDIQRLGVRFINHIATATPENLREYLRDPPTCPSNLPLKEFVYESTFMVPGYPFGVRVIKVMQPSMPELQQSTGLFIDLGVYSANAISNEGPELDQALTQMRWLKNKVFFTLLTDRAIKSFDDQA